MNASPAIRRITAEEVHRSCAWADLVEALHAAHRGPLPLTGRSLLQHAEDSLLTLSAWLPEVAMATKSVTVIPANGAAGPNPAVQAEVLLFDGASGAPLALIEGTALTYRKTAADSALGARLLARRHARRLVMVGAGALAAYLVRAHLAVLPAIDEVAVWNRTADKARSLARTLSGDGIDAVAVDNLEAAVRQADIVCCATASPQPVVRGEWLKPGVHVDLVGAFTPKMREIDEAGVVRARLFVDSRLYAIDEAGDLAQPLARGAITREAIEADLFQLCRGEVAFERLDDDITLFKNAGGAHLDLFAALHVWRHIASGEDH